MEDAIYNPIKLSQNKFCDYIDISSFASYWLVLELTENYDSAVGRSVYMYKDKNKTMKAGPV